MDKEVIIIGAGISGLSAGCYLQMNGYKTQIFEMWKLPGGVCTAWSRKGYTFDGCIHWLTGSGPSNSFYKFWQELHVIQGREIVDFEEFKRIEYGKGKIFSVYTDADKLEKEMLKVAPEDEKHIRKLTSAIKQFSRIQLPIEKPRELLSLSDLAKLVFTQIPTLIFLAKWSKTSIRNFSSRFSNKELKEIFFKIFGIDDFPMIGLLMTLAVMSNKSAGYPIGGSLEFSKAIEKRYLELGGKINYDSKITKVLVENDKAEGVRLDDGREFRSDIVISAADGHYTIFEMLKGKYIDKEIEDNYKNLSIFPPTLQVSLGIARDFKGIPHSLAFQLERPILTSDRKEIKEMTIRIYNFDQTMAPEGKTALTTIIGTDYDYWERLKKEDPEKYNSEKQRIADEVIDALERKFGDIKDKVEVSDVATPITYVRYTNNWRGSWEGWLPTMKAFGKEMKKTLPGLDKFYMIGQWVEPGGGLPPAVMSGRNVTQLICKKDGKKFNTFV